MYNEKTFPSAVKYMTHQGWYVRHTNWEYGNNCHGLVCIDSDMTVLLFVIVCTQKESLKKLTNDIVSAASDYVREYHLEHLPVRFDRIIISEGGNGHSIKHDNDILPTIDSYIFYEQLRERQHLTEIIN